MASLLDQPHHDGSPIYVPDQEPALGSRVRVWLRTSPESPVRAAWLRSTPDAEPYFEPMLPTPETAYAVWWSAELWVRNPVQRYRFLLDTGPDRQGATTYSWLNAAGVSGHDVPDAHDFVLTAHPPPPAWGHDAVVYQVFPDRFARSDAADQRATPGWARPAAWSDPPVHEGPDTPLQLYGGDLSGVREHLGHLVHLDATTLYLTPFFPAESNHRYNATSFDEVDPLLGGDQALVRLVEAAHARGLRVLGDITTNHTGDTHAWFRRALADPTSAERGFYYFTDDGGYETWKGHHTLPKLDHTDPELRRRLTEGSDSVVARWLAPPFGLDGWRVDVANMTGRRGATDVAHRVARTVRRTATEVRPDALVLAEHGHDASGDLDGDGWHATMNYVGFSFPVWTWVRRPDGHVPSFGLPVGLPRRTGPQAVAAMRAFTARFGWRAVLHSWNILGSHDTPRIRTVTGSGARHRLAAGLQFTLPGVPMVFAGDEIGLEGVDGEDARRTMPWQDRGSWDHDTLTAYARLAGLRRTHVALREGGLRWAHVDDDVLVFLREHPRGSVLVAAARTESPAVVLPGAGPGRVDGSLLFTTETGGRDLVEREAETVLPGTPGPALRVWAL